MQGCIHASDPRSSPPVPPVSSLVGPMARHRCSLATTLGPQAEFMISGPLRGYDPRPPPGLWAS